MNSCSLIFILLNHQCLSLVTHITGYERTYADLLLMAVCEHFVIVYFTFWLLWSCFAKHPTKKVIEPRFQLLQGKMWWGFIALPSEWIRL